LLLENAVFTTSGFHGAVDNMTWKVFLCY